METSLYIRGLPTVSLSPSITRHQVNKYCVVDYRPQNEVARSELFLHTSFCSGGGGLGGGMGAVQGLP